MIYYAYKITNITNNKFYVGVHSAHNFDDGYFGSGLVIKKAIKKYGKENFIKEILQCFVSKEEMYAYEKNFITEAFLQNPLVYNIACGGSGGSIEQNRKSFTGKHTAETKAKISAANKGRIHTKETKVKLKANSWARKDPIKQREHAVFAASLSSKSRCVDGKLKDGIKENISKGMKRMYAALKERGIRPKGGCLKGVPKTKISCPHCGTLGAKHVMYRWHFDHCKNNTTISG